MFRTHKTLYFVLFILGAIGIAIGLLFAIQSFRTDEEIASGYDFPFKKNLLRHRGVEIPEEENSEVAGWQTYRNEEYGFEFRYPSEWKDQGRDISVQNYFSKIPDISVLSIRLISDKASLSEIAYKELKANACPGDRIIEYKQTGVLYVLYCSASSESYVFIADLPNGHKIEFSYNDNFEDAWTEEKKLLIFNQILSTFEFIPTISLEISEPIDTSDWNSYRNEKWGFGFKYPKGTKLSEHNFSDVGVTDKFRISCRYGDECMNVTAEFPNGQIMDFVFQKIELGRDLSGAVNKQKITVANKEYEIWIDKNYYIKVWLNNGSIWLYNDIGPSGVRSTDINLFLNVLSTFKFLGLEYVPKP